MILHVLGTRLRDIVCHVSKLYLTQPHTPLLVPFCSKVKGSRSRPGLPALNWQYSHGGPGTRIY